MKKFIFSAKGRVLLSILVFMIVCCPVLLLSYSAGEQAEPETDLRYQTDMYYEYLSNMKYEVVSSDNYIVSDKYISRIKPNTTIKDFVSGLSTSNVKITLDDIEVTDGIVKTGMVLNFNDQTYTLIVIGDVNKDGLLNYIDTSMIINNSKIIELDEVSKIASDINNDNLINKEDVTSSINYIFEGKLDKDEISKVSKPSLEIVNGTKDKYDWYQDRITIKLNSNGAYTSSYKIIGVNEEYVSNVSDGTEIELRGGAYKVIAWNSNEQGIRSDVVTTTVKIDEVHKFRTSFNSGNLYLREYMGEVNEDLDLVIPAYYYGYPVYGVGHEDAIVDYDLEVMVLTNIVGRSLDLEGDMYSSTTIINSLSIENGIEEIGVGAFSGFITIEGDFIVPDSVKYIEGAAFAFSCPGYSAEPTMVKGRFILGNSVERIGTVAFGAATGRGDFIIPDSVEEVEFGALASIYINGDVYIGKSVSVLPDSLFDSSSFKNIYFVEDGSLTTIEQYAFYHTDILEGNLIIPDSVSKIDANAFYSLELAGNLVVGKGVKTIERTTFERIDVEGDVILSNVETIEEMAFENAFVGGNINLGNKLKYVGTGAFYNTVMEQGDFVIPGSLESIGSYAFQHFFASNSRLVLSEGLVNIQPSAFQKCIFNGDLVIPNSVVVIGDRAFEGASINGKLVLGNSVSSIGKNAFNHGLFSGDLVIPGSIKSIGEYAFNDNLFNGELKYDGILSNVGAYAFANNISLHGTIEVDSTVDSTAIVGTNVIMNFN